MFSVVNSFNFDELNLVCFGVVHGGQTCISTRFSNSCQRHASLIQNVTIVKTSSETHLKTNKRFKNFLLSKMLMQVLNNRSRAGH